MLHSRDQVLRLKWFAYKFVCLHRKGLFCDGAIHHARHQNHRRAVQLGMLLDALTDFVAILVGHDHVGDHNVGSLLLDVVKAVAASGYATTSMFSRRNAIFITSRMVALSSMNTTVGVVDIRPLPRASWRSRRVRA